jgi:hypothetical protein
VKIASAGVLLLAVLGSLPGCGSARRAGSFEPEVVAGDRAAIYIYRERGVGGTVRIVLDQRDAFDLRPGDYAARVVKPGEHIVRAEGASSVARTVSVAAGDAAYVEVSAGALARHPSLATPDEDTARERIAGSVRIP